MRGCSSTSLASDPSPAIDVPGRSPPSRMNQHPFATALPSPIYRASPPVYPTKRTRPEYSRSRTQPYGATREISGFGSGPPSHPSVKAHHAGHRRPSGRFVLQDGKISLTLSGQEDGASTPVYGQESTVDGFISIKESQAAGILSVSGKVRFALGIFLMFHDS